MKKYLVNRDQAMVQIALASAAMINAIKDAKFAEGEPFQDGDERYFRWRVTNEHTGAVFLLDLPVIPFYFQEVEDAEP